MKKFLLATLNSKFSHQSLPLEMLSKYHDNEKRHDLAVKHFTINQPLEVILREIFLTNADYVFFSCYIWNIEETLHLIKALRVMRPQIFIGVGGPEVSYDAKGFLRENLECDLVMTGEGEKVFTKLLDELERDHPDLSGIAALNYRENEEIVSTPPLDGVVDMAELPFPYEEDLRDCADKIIYYESSRGCPYRCAYCLSSIEKVLRFRPLVQVYRDLDLFLQACPKQVKFIDRTFNAKREHALAMWRYIAAHDNGVTNFHFEITADLLDEEELDLKDARIMALQSHINPHFMNNTLEIINWEARLAGNDKVSEMISSLGTLLDAALDRKKQPEVPLKEELTYVKAYLFIMKERFGKRLEVTLEIPEELYQEKVPRLILQPVIENAIAHGVQVQGTGKVRITGKNM